LYKVRDSTHPLTVYTVTPSICSSSSTSWWILRFRVVDILCVGAGEMVVTSVTPTNTPSDGQSTVDLALSSAVVVGVEIVTGDCVLNPGSPVSAPCSAVFVAAVVDGMRVASLTTLMVKLVPFVLMTLLELPPCSTQ
jgi:hypothetical protein